MATLEDLRNELLSWVQPLSPLLAEKMIQRAWAEVRSRRHWSFLLSSGQLFSPGELSTGTFSVTQFSTAAQADASAITTLASVSNPAITFRQIRFAGGPVYEVSAYNSGTGALTLNRIYRETTNSAISYSLFRAYYGPPLLDSTGVEDTDFLRWVVVSDPANAWRFTKLYGTRQELDILDPQRASSGQPWGMYAFQVNSSKVPRFEMWPHPLFERSWKAVYQKRGTDLASGESLPPQIPEELVIERALVRACNWAKTNMGVFPALKGVGWGDAAIEHQRNYIDMLKRAERDDEEAYQQYWLLREFPSAPFGLEWLVDHDEHLLSGMF